MDKLQRDDFVREVARQLCHLTGDKWDPEVGEGIFARLNGPDSRSISITGNHNWSQVEFSGRYPRSFLNGDEFGLDYGDTYRIGCSVQRGGANIARDLTRRFLPHYEELWQRGLKNLAAHMENVQQVRNVLDRLEEAWGTSGHWNQAHPEEASLRKDFIIDDSSISATMRVISYSGRGPVVSHLELRGGLDVEIAAQIGLLLREMEEELAQIDEPALEVTE